MSANALLAPVSNPAQLAAAFGTHGESADINPAYLAMAGLVNSSLSAKALDDKDDGADIGAMYGAVTAVTALKGNKHFMIGMAILNGMPKVVATLLDGRAALSIFGLNGLNVDAKTAVTGSGGSGGSGSGTGTGTGTVTGPFAAGKRNIELPKNWRAGPGVPFDGPWGNAIRMIAQQHGEGPQAALRLGEKLKMEFDRIEHERLFNSLTPLQYGGMGTNSLTSNASIFSMGTNSDVIEAIQAARGLRPGGFVF